MGETLLVIHGGAPTAVMNASLYGVIKEARAHGMTTLAAKGGSGGVLAESFINLSDLDERVVESLPTTPASFIGTSRYPISDEGYTAMVEVLLTYSISGVLFNGGNGSMDSCGKLARAIEAHPTARKRGIRIVGIPKTIDNDLAVTDHAPGFGSAARYLVASVQELCQDVASLPIHVCVIEAMGRNAGWLTASAVLARRNGLGPHMIIPPEIPFDEERFLDEVSDLSARHGGVVVVASEGLRDRKGEPIVPPIFQVGRSVYYGDVSSHLSNLVIKRLGIKARSEKPGILGRCSIAWQSDTDRQEAILAGSESVKALRAGRSEVMVGFERVGDGSYTIRPILIPIEEVMLHERTLPHAFLDPATGAITEAFASWCSPLLGSELPSFAPRIV